MLIFALHMFEALAAIFLPAQNPSFMHPCIRFYRSSNPSASFTANHQSCKLQVIKQNPTQLDWKHLETKMRPIFQWCWYKFSGKIFLDDSWTSTCASLLEEIIFDLEKGHQNSLTWISYPPKPPTRSRVRLFRPLRWVLGASVVSQQDLWKGVDLLRKLHSIHQCEGQSGWVPQELSKIQQSKGSFGDVEPWIRIRSSSISPGRKKHDDSPPI